MINKQGLCLSTAARAARVVIDHRNMTEIGHGFFRLYSRGRRLNMVIKTLKKTSKSVRRYMKSWGLRKIFKKNKKKYSRILIDDKNVDRTFSRNTKMSTGHLVENQNIDRNNKEGSKI